MGVEGRRVDGAGEEFREGGGGHGVDLLDEDRIEVREKRSVGLMDLRETRAHVGGGV